jgi:hypothetical protein
MTTYTDEHASETGIARAGHASSDAPSACDVAFGVSNILAGAGIVFMSFLAPIPGLLPALILTGLLVAPLLIPPLVLGAVAWLAFAGLRLAARLTSRAIALSFAYVAFSSRRPHGAYRARIGAYPARHGWSSHPFSSRP